MSSGTDTLSAAEEMPPAPAPPAAPPEPEPPITVIERKPGWHLVDLRELWRFREVLFFLVWRDVKVRYKQTVLGVVWALLQPLATMAAFFLIFGHLVRGSQPTALPYPLFALAGLIPWTFFAGAVGGACSSVVGNQNLVTKVYFPRLLVPLGTVLASLLDLFIAFGLLLVLMPFFGRTPGWGFLALPLVLLVLLALASGLGVLLSALTVAYRDFRVIVPLALQLGLYFTPAIFVQDWAEKLGPRMKTWLPLNPLYGVVVNFRAAAVGEPFEWQALGLSTVWAAALLLCGCLYFRRVERGFADII